MKNHRKSITDAKVSVIEDRIWVHGFNEENAQKFNDRVLKTAEKDPYEPIVVYINSYGGAVDCLASMVSVLDSVPNPVITIATGTAMSCGAMLLSHGDVRCVGPHARVMIHEVSAAAWGNVNDMKTDTHEVDRLNQYFMGLLARNCGKSLKQLKSQFTNERREIYLTPEACVKFGIADHVGIPAVEKHASFELLFKKPLNEARLKRGRK